MEWIIDVECACVGAILCPRGHTTTNKGFRYSSLVLYLRQVGLIWLPMLIGHLYLSDVWIGVESYEWTPKRHVSRILCASSFLLL